MSNVLCAISCRRDADSEGQQPLLPVSTNTPGDRVYSLGDLARWSPGRTVKPETENCTEFMHAIIVHGGAGQWLEECLARALEGVGRALDIGNAVLARGGSALDAVERP